MPKWIEKWKVPSSSSNKEYIVSKAEDGTYGCSCPVWKFRREECHHIISVKSGFGKAVDKKQKPEYVLAMVQKPIYDKTENQLLIPLVPIDDGTMMEATICYYLLKYGYSMGEVREMRRIPPSWTIRKIKAHVETYGEAKYPKTEYRKGD